MRWLLLILALAACGVDGTPEPKGDPGIPPVWES